MRSAEPAWPAPAPRRDASMPRVHHALQDPRQLGERSSWVVASITPSLPTAKKRRQRMPSSPEQEAPSADAAAATRKAKKGKNGAEARSAAAE